ncbi:major facilitator superfamily domain-containing protein 1-like [Oppia nitens]|uniref:major facilitator superfamily domain-containing protein 1-like n=1 Tax=Oppia nitens TaxID=1686743 RepID=UPI0023DB89DE|nr:major facilitator superfamily domain-containing protein 1-like [Oppia nitens]
MNDEDERLERPLIAPIGQSSGSRDQSCGESDTIIIEESGCMASPLCHPLYSLHRYFVLIFMCFLGFGSYFCYDGPGALQKQITTDMNVGVSEFSALYAWYSWPNVILCFFGGFLIDRLLGIRLGAIIFSVFILIGQLVLALGAFTNRFWLMNFGRFIFGIGGESLAVTQNTYAVSWFKNKEINMVFGLQLSFARVGSTVNFNVMKPLYDTVNNYITHTTGHTTLGITLSLAANTCVFSLICALILAFYDKRAERILKRSNCQTGEIVRITDVKDFKTSFWMITFICITYYVAIFPFTALGGTFFQRKYQMDQKEANGVDSIIYIISAVLSPFLGIAVDLTGRNIVWVFSAVVITLISHSLLAFTFVNPWIAMILMGIGYSILACALWPMVAMVIPEHQLGTAYGVMQSVQNLGLGCIVLLAGYIVDKMGYIALEVFFLLWMCLCLIFVIILFINDLKHNGFLNMSTKQRKLLTEVNENDRQSTNNISETLSSHDILTYG